MLGFNSIGGFVLWNLSRMAYHAGAAAERACDRYEGKAPAWKERAREVLEYCLMCLELALGCILAASRTLLPIAWRHVQRATGRAWKWAAKASRRAWAESKGLAAAGKAELEQASRAAMEEARADLQEIGRRLEPMAREAAGKARIALPIAASRAKMAIASSPAAITKGLAKAWDIRACCLCDLTAMEGGGIGEMRKENANNTQC